MKCHLYNLCNQEEGKKNMTCLDELEAEEYCGKRKKYEEELEKQIDKLRTPSPTNLEILMV